MAKSETPPDDGGNADSREPGDEGFVSHPMKVPRASAGALPRRFYLLRHEDHTGLSGDGIVAWGVQFPNGWCTYCWTTAPWTIQIAQSPYDVQHIHGHNYRTRVVFMDPEDPGDPDDPEDA
jgi:hypothetical protein